jgi:polyhydroxyalkanoate synthesis regulator phasin
MPQPKSAKSAKSAKSSRPSGSRGAPGAGKAAAPTGRTRSLAGKSASSPSSPEAQAARDEALRVNLVQLREVLAGGVMLTAARVQEAMDDAVRRGKLTRRDAEELARTLVDTGRRQSFDLLTEVEQLVEKSKGDLSSASNLVRESTDRVLQQVDRVRRTAGVGQSFPIPAYDELTAAQITTRLDGLSAGDLRRVREHERAHANRKTVIVAVERALG